MIQRSLNPTHNPLCPFCVILPLWRVCRPSGPRRRSKLGHRAERRDRGLIDSQVAVRHRRVEGTDQHRPKVPGEVDGVLLAILKGGQKLEGTGQNGSIAVVAGSVGLFHLPEHSACIGQTHREIGGVHGGRTATILPFTTVGNPPRQST